MIPSTIKTSMFLCCTCLLLSCGEQNKSTSADTQNQSYPAMPGFNKAASDSMAIALADKVMKAMGGWESWKDTRYIGWTFLGRRHLIWDKYTGDVRINSLNEEIKIILNIHSMQGKAMKNGAPVTQPDSLQKYLEMGKRIWINDSYWLVMPFKMKDSGVTLTYVGEGKTNDGESSHIVALRFENVGVTPENKFHVWVDKDSHLVIQWAYFQKAEQNEPDFVIPWSDYNKYSEILLSGVRGDLQLTNIMVTDSLNENVFISFEAEYLHKKVSR